MIIERPTSLANAPSGLKLTCTVHGPRPLPKSAPFTPNLLLSTHVKFAPFAAQQRRGYIRDASERDLGAHLETALRGVLIGERWPKSGLEVIITVLEGEEDHLEDSRNGKVNDGKGRANGWSLMSILAGCITIASAAIADAGIDCVDLISGGVAAMIRQPNHVSDRLEHRRSAKLGEAGDSLEIVTDPCLSEHQGVIAACVVGYLQSRDEVTEIWARGELSRPSSSTGSGQSGIESLINQAVEAASSARLVLTEAAKESAELKLQRCKVNSQELTDSKMKQSAVNL